MTDSSDNSGLPETRDRDPLEDFALQVHLIDDAIKTPAVAAALGPRLTEEFRSVVAGFRGRFRSLMPGAQQDIFSAAAPAKAAPKTP